MAETIYTRTLGRNIEENVMIQGKRHFESYCFRAFNRLQILHLSNYVLFTSFCFCFLSGLESDILLLFLTKTIGQPIPDFPYLYAFLFTAILIGIQMLLNRKLKFDGKRHALSFVPSFLLLALTTSVIPECSFVTVLLLASTLTIFVIFCCICRHCSSESATFPQLLIPNLACMLGCFAFVSLVSNTNDEFHYELRIQNIYVKGDYKKALLVGNESLASNRRLTALRALSLARIGKMGESLFEYPISENDTDLFLHHSDVNYMILPMDSITSVIGYVPSEKDYMLQMSNRLHSTYLSRYPSLRDYWLCTLLLQKRLDDFAIWLPRFYNVSDKLPKHYREALILYRSLFVHPRIIYDGTASEEANYADFMDLADKYADAVERKNNLRRLYGGTYWWFFFETGTKDKPLLSDSYIHTK